ncbi:MAG TPA: aminopeptidase P family N-terminal domain-containing protein [Steroidobacteraceae bacterium]
MKRGLVTLDQREIPREVYAARIEALQAQLRRSSAHVALVYGDVSRSGDINYLTNLCLYWSEAVLAVPRDGPPALITKLSKRVTTWMRQTSTLQDIRSGPQLAESVSKYLQDQPGQCRGSLALIDLPWWPHQLVEQIREALPDMLLEDLGPAVRAARLVPSVETRRLLESGAGRLADALRLAWSGGTSAEECAAIAVRALRRDGFQDATVAAGGLGDSTEWIDAIGQYRDVWVRRSLSRNGPSATLAETALRDLLAAARPGVNETSLARRTTGRFGGSGRARLACYPYLDLETRGLYRSPDDSNRPLQVNEVVCIQLTLCGDDGPVIATDTVSISPSGAVPLCRKELAS